MQSAPADWTVVSLGDVVSSLGGLWGQGEPADGYVEVLALRGTDFARARSLDIAAVPRRFEKAKSVNRRLLDATCVVVEASGGSKDQPVGRSLLVTQALLDRADVPLSAASFCKIFWVDSEIADPRFIHAVLQNLYRSGEIERFQSQSTGLRNLRTRQLLADFCFALPPLGVQRRNAAVLAAFDRLFELNSRRIELLEGLARAVYREWFVHLRFPGYADEKLVDSDCGEVPKGWRVCPIEDVVSTLVRGLAPKYDENGRWTVVNQRCIRDQRITLAPARRHGGDVAEAKRLRFGDVLVNSTGVGTLGRVALVLEEHGRMTADSHVTIVRPRSSQLQPWFGMGMLDRERAFQTMGTGSTGQTELGRHAIAELPVAVPPKAVLDAFAAAAWPLLRPISKLLYYRDSLVQARDLLLPRLVNGKLDLSDMDLGALTPAEAG